MSRRSGSMLMEFVMVMPILFILIMLVLQFAHIWLAKQMVSYAAFCAARATMACSQSECERAAKKAAVQTLAWVNILGDGGLTSGVKVPGWGTIPESDSAIARISVEDFVPKQGRYAACTVKFKFPLLIPVAGQMISYCAGTSGASSGTMKGKATYQPGVGWTGEENLFHGFPYIELSATGVLPMPYSTANLPTGGYVL